MGLIIGGLLFAFFTHSHATDGLKHLEEVQVVPQGFEVVEPLFTLKSKEGKQIQFKQSFPVDHSYIVFEPKGYPTYSNLDITFHSEGELRQYLIQNFCMKPEKSIGAHFNIETVFQGYMSSNAGGVLLNPSEVKLLRYYLSTMQGSKLNIFDCASSQSEPPNNGD